jgi:hypothetical protein
MIVLQSLPLPNEDFGRSNKSSECVFEALFKGVSTRFGLRIVEKCFENSFGKVGSAFQNLRLGSIKLLQKIVASQKFNTSHRNLAEEIVKAWYENTFHIKVHVVLFMGYIAKCRFSSDKTSSIQHIKRMLDESGAVWQKFAQMLSSNEELIGNELAVALQSMLTKCP